MTTVARRALLTVLTLLVLLAVTTRTTAYASVGAQACAPTGTERVRTDKARYPHYETVHVSGRGYAARCAVTVRITRPDGSVVVGDGSQLPGSDTAVTSASGRLAYDYTLSDIDGYYRIDVVGAGGAVLATREFADAFGLAKLTLSSKNGSENYVFTAGNTVVISGSVDPADATHAGRAYRLSFRDPSGAAHATTTCTRDGSKGADVNASYVVLATDPVSTSATWKAVLEQYVDAGCTTLEKTATLPFAVASSRAFADAGLTSPQSFFRIGSTPFVTFAGLTPGQADWSTVWLRSGGATACQNSGGADRPDADANGLLPSGTGAFLQYPPGTAGSAWNLQASYDGTCAAPTSANQGPWTVKLTRDATHFVTLPAFSIDATSPVSSATSIATASTTGLTVSYTASDTGSGASGVATVDLYAKAPGAGAYVKVATDSAPGGSGSISFIAAQGDGIYSFYTVATDKAGNVEAPPSVPDSTTTVDTTPPASQASSPAFATATAWTVAYTAADPASGLAKVDLLVKGPGDSAYAVVASNATPGASGSFSYTATQGEGRYSFYTVATDKAGYVEAAPDGADATTLLDTTRPAAVAFSAASATQSPFLVTYTATDTGGDASGLARVELYAKAPGSSSYVKVATDTAPSTTGSFSFAASGGDGTYDFYVLATDQAGNTEVAPAAPDTTTALDRAAPDSSASAGAAFTTARTIQVAYSASDPGPGASGLATVELFAKGPGDAGYTSVATDASPGAAGSFSYQAPADGIYSFYTVATDRVGNSEPVPVGPDTMITVDTATPTSQASSPASAPGNIFTIDYTAADPGPGASGLAQVRLFVKGPADSGYGLAATDSSPAGSGSFEFTATGGTGDYSFYTIATDGAGNVEDAPGAPDSTTSVAGSSDTTAPSAVASSPEYASSNSFTIGYAASDAGLGASGLAKVELYGRPPGASNFTRIATDTTGAASGSFDYTAGDGDGSYAFYAIATDNAGNVESAPAGADATTLVDTNAPGSSATSQPYSTSSPVTVSYTAADAGTGASGLAKVELYAEGPGASDYAKVATDATPGASGTFSFTATQGNGTYRFYTLATDSAGNVEAQPSAADTTTKIDPTVGQVEVVDEMHYTFTGATSVGFSWRGAATDIRYGATTAYGSTANAHTPTPLPPSSPGPFQEVELTGLDAGATYHYSIGGGPDHTFATAPTGDFRFDVEADIGSSAQFSKIPAAQAQIASDNPAFVLAAGDLTYGHPYGPTAVDTHFNDSMAWSTKAAYMPAWGNHEYEDPTNDDLRNYKGRFILPHAAAAVDAPATGCCGDDWSWFDAGPVRFIAYPEPYTSRTWTDWQAKADPIFAAAQADPAIHFIVTFGHRPAYSTGLHPGETTLASILNTFGDRYDKYRLNLNGHSHDYERYQPIHGVTHVTTGGGGSPLETPWNGTDERTAFRAMHLEHLRVDVSSTGMRVDAICGPSTSDDDITCVQGSVIDSFTFGTQPPPPPPTPSTLYVAKNDPACTNNGAGTSTQPFCSISAAASRVSAGQTVQVAAGTYSERVSLSTSGTAAAPINFIAKLGDTVTVTGGTNGFYTNGKAYVTIQGFTVTGTTQDAIVVSKNSSHITVRGNHVTNAGQPSSGQTARGIRVDITNDNVIDNNTVDHNTDYGIYVVGGSTRNLITGNRVFNNARGFERAASGIRIHSSAGNTISGNISHDNEDSGIEMVTGAQNNLVVNNVVYNNNDHGIDDTTSAPNNSIIGNVVYKSVTAGIDLEGGATGSTVYNNIAVDNGINSPRTKGNIRVDSTSTSGTTLDYNIVYLSVPGRNYEWGVGYDTLFQMQLASGQETHSLQADPMWRSPATADFGLRPGSPAIDSANSGIAGAAPTDAHDSARIDDPLTANTGVGPRNYDDRGPLEYEPESRPPRAALTVTPPSGAIDLAVTADASASVDDDGLSSIESYTFDFGDGAAAGPQASPTANHTYTQPGTYDVMVTVQDSTGLTSTATSTVTVRDDAPAASLAMLPTSGPAPLSTTADASSSTDTDATPISTYSFDWGDGSPSTDPQSQPTATHTYADVGTYTVTVTVTDTAGRTSQDTADVTVFGSNVPPTAALSVSPSSGDVDLAVTADASASTDPDDGIASYSFEWGDGSASTGDQAEPTAAHTYRAAGSYTVAVTVKDGAGGSSRATRQVTVTDPAPVARLTMSPSSGMAPLDVTADASASTDSDGTPIASYNFAWGDGSAATGPQAAATAPHTYAAAGTYTITVTVKDTAGQASTATAQVTAKPNLIGNPGFEASTSGWNTSGSITGVTLTRVAGGHSGGWSAKLVNGASASGTCTLNDSPDWVKPTVAGRYNTSVWVRGDTAGATLKLRVTEYNGSTNVGSASTTATLTTSWQKLSVNYTPVVPGTSSLDFNAYVSGAAPGTCFYADDAATYLP